MSWKSEIIDGRETYQLHVRVDRLVVERDGSGWKWTSFDTDGNVLKSVTNYINKAEAQFGAVTWAYAYIMRLRSATIEETL